MNTTLRKQLIIFAGRAAVVVLLSALINGYLINRMRDQQQEIEEKKVIIAELSFQEDKLAELKKEYEDVINAAFILEDSLFPRLDPRPFKNKIADFVDDTGNHADITLGSDVAVPTEYPGIYTASFTLHIEGTLKSLNNFLEELKAFDHFVNINSLSVSGKPDIGGTINTAINATVYLGDK